MIQELDRVVLATDLQQYGLQRGDIGTVILVHQQGAGYEVEFMTLDGQTVAVATLSASQVRPVQPGEIAHVRAVAVA
jgi:hypothetical protein